MAGRFFVGESKDVYYKDEKIPKRYYIVHSTWEFTYKKTVTVADFETVLQNILTILKDTPENWVERLDDAERGLKPIATKPSSLITPSL